MQKQLQYDYSHVFKKVLIEEGLKGNLVYTFTCLGSQKAINWENEIFNKELLVVGIHK